MTSIADMKPMFDHTDSPEDAIRKSGMVLHPVQREFVNCTKIYKSFTAGIGSGKSFVGAYDLIRYAEPGTLVAVVAPTYRMLADATMRSFVDIAEQLGYWDEKAYRKSDNQAVLKHGVEVLFRSGDNPASLRGPNLRRAWLDEAGLMQEEVFNVMIGRLRHGGKQGSLTATFTPQGKEHWTYRLFADKTNPNVELFHCSTKDNIFLDPEFYNNLLLQYGKGEGGTLRAQQELEGEFVCVEGAEWPPNWFGPKIWFDEWPNDDTCIKSVMLDSSKGIGGKSGDYSCFAKVMYSHGDLYVEFDMDNTRNASEMAATAVEIQREFAPHYFGVESEFGGPVLVDDIANRSDVERVIMPLVLVPTTGTPKEVRIRRLTPYLARGMVRFKNTEDTKIGVTQFESFPHAMHDDAPDALEGAIRIINESGCAA